MAIRRPIMVVAIVVGISVAGGVILLATDIVTGFSLEAASSLLPRWAVTAQVGRPVATFAADTKKIDTGKVVAELDRFAAAHGFVRQENSHTMLQSPDPAHLRLYYVSPLANLSFYTTSARARIAVVSQPGRSNDLTSVIGDVQSAFGQLGFTIENQP